MTTTTVMVAGMTCHSCAASVNEEIADLPGVNAVDVDLTSGAVTIESDAPLETGAIRSAVEEAGYRLAG